ncbi:MAG: S9 family peptidase [Anaerolineae bacterium]|nr:S9 family peptidase [Anaerolineae bacterium]
MSNYPIERYLNVRMAYGGQFNGDSNSVVFLSNLTGVPQLFQIKVDSQGQVLWPDQLTFNDNRVMEGHTSPLADDYRLIYSRDVGGNENAQFFLLDTQTGAETRLTTDDNAMHIFGSWSADGSQICYAANSRDKSLFDVYVQAFDGTAQVVYENSVAGYLFGGTFSPNQQRLLFQHTVGSFDARLLEIDIATREARQVSPTESGVRYAGAVYLDNETALVITDKDSDFLYVAQVNLQEQTLQTVVSLDWDIVAFTLTKDKRTIAYTVNADGHFEIHLLDRQTGATKQVDLGAVAGVVTYLKFSSDGRRLLFTIDRATRTADVYVWQMANDTMHAITQSSHAGIPSSSFVAPQLIHFPTFDTDDNGETRQIPAWLYLPKTESDTPFPVVFVVHGGPEGQALPQFSGLIQSLVNNGYAAFVPNVRGSTGYGKAYSHLDDVRLRMDSVKDLAYGAEWVKQQPHLDGKRIAIYGRSYGGFMVLSALVTYPDIWVAAAEFVGISNFVTFLENTSNYRRAHRESEYGSLANDRDFLESVSPIHQIDNICVPLFVQHGANDPRVPLSETEQLVERLRQRDIAVELLVFADEGHGITKMANQVTAFSRMIDFLNRYVK